MSVRALMVVVLLVGCGFGWVVHRARVQRQAVVAIERAGGSVKYDWQFRNGRPVRNGKPRWSGWVVSDLGVDYFDNITYVDLKDRGSDTDLAYIKHLHRLEHLRLSGSKVTDAGLSHLQGLQSLRWLTLDDTKVSDAGLAHLGALTRLEGLSLAFTEVSDAGIPQLKRLTSLKMLSLFLTRVSYGGIQELRASMPKTRIGPGGPAENERRALELNRAMQNARNGR